MFCLRFREIEWRPGPVRASEKSNRTPFLIASIASPCSGERDTRRICKLKNTRSPENSDEKKFHYATRSCERKNRVSGKISSVCLPLRTVLFFNGNTAWVLWKRDITWRTTWSWRIWKKTVRLTDFASKNANFRLFGFPNASSYFVIVFCQGSVCDPLWKKTRQTRKTVSEARYCIRWKKLIGKN